jgi:hypothetical protein
MFFYICVVYLLLFQLFLYSGNSSVVITKLRRLDVENLSPTITKIDFYKKSNKDSPKSPVSLKKPPKHALNIYDCTYDGDFVSTENRNFKSDYNNNDSSITRKIEDETVAVIKKEISGLASTHQFVNELHPRSKCFYNFFNFDRMKKIILKSQKNRFIIIISIHYTLNFGFM